jgi:hypothetical protein
VKTGAIRHFLVEEDCPGYKAPDLADKLRRGGQDDFQLTSPSGMFIL